MDVVKLLTRGSTRENQSLSSKESPSSPSTTEAWRPSRDEYWGDALTASSVSISGMSSTEAESCESASVRRVRAGCEGDASPSVGMCMPSSSDDGAGCGASAISPSSDSESSQELSLFEGEFFAGPSMGAGAGAGAGEKGLR